MLIRIKLKKLSIHHIDYNKENNEITNLTSLCNSCHSKTNHDRDYWFAYLTYNIKEYYENKIAI